MGAQRVLAWDRSAGAGQRVPQQCKQHRLCALRGFQGPGCTSLKTACVSVRREPRFLRQAGRMLVADEEKPRDPPLQSMQREAQGLERSRTSLVPGGIGSQVS